jgi:Fe-S-cluster containining protein
MFILQAFQDRERYARWLDAEQQKRNPAGEQGKTECVRCGFCCAVRTCVPLPSELDSIAEHLKVGVKEMIATYMVGDQIDGHYFLRWANTEQTDVLGKFLSARRTYDQGVCILYDEPECVCRIYPVCPVDAKRQRCWEDDGSDRYDTIKQWQDGDLERLCPDMVTEDDYW